MGDLVRSLPLVVFLFMVAFPVAMAAVMVFAGVQGRRRAALITATPTANIGMAADGYREFEARIEAVEGHTIEALLTRAPCVWYHAKVEGFPSEAAVGKRAATWITVRHVTSSAPFLVRDSTGVCLVEPFRAEVTPTDKSVWYGATAIPADRNPPKVGPGESATGLVEVAGGPNSRFRYTEERIYAGDPLLVLGEFNTGRHKAAFDDEDDEDDTSVSEAADESALTDEDREEIAREQQEEAIRTRATAITKAWIARGSGRQPFILSTTLQAVHVTQSSMGGQAALTMAAVPAAIALFLLWVRFS